MTHERSHDAEAGLVSVVIPAFNYAQFVVEAIKSVKSQDYRNVEIIVVDDGSTDDTQAILEKRTDIHYIRQDNRGLSDARNRGMEAASGAFLLFLDADDRVGPRSISRLVDALCHDSTASFAVCRSRYFANDNPDGLWRFLLREWKLPNRGTVDLALCFFNIAPPHAFLVRKADVDRLALRFDTGLRACEDYDFWFKLALLTKPPCLVTSTSVYYRQHAKSMSRARANQSRHDAILCVRILEAFNASSQWLGDRVRFNYLYPMLASALLTARELWRTDRDKFAEFFSGHIVEVQKQIDKLTDAATLDPDCVSYITLCKLSALRMRIRDCSIDHGAFLGLITCLPGQGTCAKLLCQAAWRRPGRMSDLIHFLLSELRYFTLGMLYRARLES